MSARLDPRPRLMLVAILLAYALWGAFYIYRTSIVIDGERVFTLWDDAMISMRYAQNLAEGHGLVWNAGGERVQGITNLGIALVMALLHFLPFPQATAAAAFQALNLGLCVAILFLVHEIARLLADGDERAGLAAAVATALYAPLSIWSLQGADTGFAAALVLAAWWQVTRAVDRGRGFPVSAFLPLAAAVVVRLDMSLSYGIFLAASMLLAPRRLHTTAIGAALLVIVLAGLLAFGLVYYGDPLPNTYYLKATGHPRLAVLWFGAMQSRLMLAGFTTPWLVAAGAASFAFLRGRPALWLGAAVFVAILAYNLWVGGDWVPLYISRHVVHAVPIFLVLFVVSARAVALAILGEARMQGPAGALAATAAALLAPLAFHPADPMREWLTATNETLFKADNSVNLRYGRFLRDHTSPEASVALYFAGIPGFFGERPSIDVLGRSDAHIARLSVDHFQPGHDKTDWDHVLGLRPSLFLRNGGGLARHPEFRFGYRRRELPTGEQYWVRAGDEDLVRP